MKNSWIHYLLSLTGILFLGLIGVSCSDDDDDNKGKEADFFHFGDHSYKIIQKNKTWTDAAADAVDMGGYLVEIGSKEEQDAIYDAIQKSGISPAYTEVPDGGGIGYIWIGATDRYAEKSWVWNGTNANGTFPLFWLGGKGGSVVGKRYVNWGGTSAGKTNEPDNFTDAFYSPKGQNAAAIGLASWPAGSSSPLGKAGEWNDIAETNKIYYIVEFDSNL